ncbi:unnamed protein product [Caenorhabditis nigoni]
MVDPRPMLENVRDLAGEAARHQLRFARQAAIRSGLYLPPLPVPHLLFPNLNHAPEQDHRQDLLAELRVENFRMQQQYLNEAENNDYRPMSPENSDNEDDEVMEAHQRQRRMRRHWRNYMHQRVDPIPQGIIDRLMEDLEREARRPLQNRQNQNNNNDNNVNNNNNNNGNYRNFNGMLSPLPSPGGSPPESEDEEEPVNEGRVADDDVEMLNVQFMEMQPNQALSRKRQNSKAPGAIKKKRVTFKSESADEAAYSDDDDIYDNIPKVAVYQKQNEDDDEGFFGGPSRRQQNIRCA